MDTMFVMILMGAGVAVALLGMFLVASERELKVKKREIEILLDKLENSPQQSTAAQFMQAGAESTELSDLRAQNRNLQNQLAALSDELEQSRGAVDDLKASQRMDAGSEIEKQELRTINDRLGREVNELRNRLAASEAQIQSAVGQSHEDGNARMQAEIDNLRRAINERDIKLGELESTRQNVPDVNALEAAHRQQQETLQQRITELERQRAIDAEKLSEMQTLRDRLTEAEGIHNSLRDEIRRHKEEIPGWQARIAAAEQNRQQLAALQAPCNELLSKQAALADRQRQLQEELVSFARLIAAATDGTGRLNSQADDEPGQSRESNSSPQGSAPTGNPAAGETGGRRFGLLGALLLLAAGGALSLQLFNAGSGPSSTPPAIAQPVTVNLQTQGPAAKSQQASLDNSAAVKPHSEPAPVQRANKEIASPITADNRTAKAEPASSGTYQVIRSSRVYAAPNELSRSVGEIEPGVNVRVVNSRDGWLEIHSKHGRPPGFIRRDVAAKISGQN